MTEFLRFVPADPVALTTRITELRAKLSAALAAGESLAIVDAAADLGGQLTGARMEHEAAQLLGKHQLLAEAHAGDEAAAWFWNAYATALQYGGQRDLAEALFAKAVALAKAGGWRRIEAMTLHHWGRSLAEQAHYDEAVSRFSDALAIREALNEASQASSRRALEALSALRAGLGQAPSPELS